MRYVLLVLPIMLIGILAFPVMADEAEWVDPQENILRLSESFVKDIFIIETTDFYSDSVLITVYRKNGNVNNNDDNKIDSNIMRFGDSWNVSDQNSTINITIKELREDRGNIAAYEGLNVIVDQWVTIYARMTGKPLPIVSIVPEERHIQNRTIVKRIFSPGSEMTINFTIKNIGKAKLKELRLKINTTLPLLSSDDKLDHELPTLGAGNFTTVSVRFRAPYNHGNFSITADATGADVFERKYYSKDSTYIMVKPYIEKLVELKKYIPEKVYMGDLIYVNLNVRNNGYNNLSMDIIDGVPAGFEIIGENTSNENMIGGINGVMSGEINGGTVSWNFTLEGNNEKVILYKIRPKKPGIYSFGYACADIEEIGIKCSEKPNKISNNKLIVSGPYVELIKLAENTEKNNTIIKITASNKGDRTAIIRLVDYVPRNYTLVGVNKSAYKSDFNRVAFKPIVLRPQSFSLLDYTLYGIDSGRGIDYWLPPVEATILDQFLYLEDRYVQKISSNELIIRS